MSKRMLLKAAIPHSKRFLAIITLLSTTNEPCM